MLTNDPAKNPIEARVTPWRRGRYASSTAFALQGFFLAVILTELPHQKTQFGLTDTTLVLVVAAISLVAGGGSVIAERLAVRWSSAPALRCGLALIAVTGMGIAFAPDATWLIAMLVVYGVAVGMVDAGANMQAVVVQHGYNRFILSSFYAAWSAGAIAGALFVSVCEAGTVPLAWTIAAAAATVAAMTLVIGPGFVGTPDSTPCPAEDSEVAPIPGKALLALGIALALAFGIDLAVGNWSALYLTDELLSSPAVAALALAAYQVAALLSRLAGDSLVRRVGPRTAARGAAVIGAAGLAIVVAAPNPAVAITGFLITGIGLPIIAPLCFSEVGHRTAGRNLDTAVARLNIFNYAGTLIGGIVVGAVAAGTTLRMGFAVPLVFAAVLLAVAGFFPTRPGVRAAAH
ncbi:MFS transporter [Nocardia sp. SSK8]|uniref:MFS transporter n=1 Tax=Nocardia sp. SSK8 TaxID=3120154 RepID=UPI003008368B